MRLFYIIFLLFLNLALSAQDINKTSKLLNKNTFSIGINYATLGDGRNSYLYNNEYTRHINKYFELSTCIGFVTFSDSVNLPIGLQPNTITGYRSTSIIPFALIVDLKIIDSKKHFAKLGLGYSLQKIKQVQFFEARSYSLNGIEINVPFYNYLNTIDGGMVFNLEYGFRIRQQFSVSLNGKYYTEGKYISLTTVGFDLSYSF